MCALLLNKVSPQETVKGVIGGSVLLPCSSAKDDLKVQECIVFWRHNDSKIVLDVVKGKDSLTNQDEEYKNRTESFPHEYQKRNFSIKLNNLQQTDRGEFSCLITATDEVQTVQLIVKFKDDGADGDDVKGSTSLHWHWFLLAIPVFVIGLIILCWRKAQKDKAPEFSHVADRDKAQ